MKSAKLLILLLTLLGLGLSGCEVMPVTRYKPELHNPLPQMETVAIVPFYNHTGNPRVDGRDFANSFALELQRIPGFKVIANKIVEDVMVEHELHKFESIDDIRYLAQLLKVDVVVIGKIHSFNMNYPPIAKFETDWYHVNPYLQPIPYGRNLPWGTEHERYIPDKIVLLTELELAKAQLKTQTPTFDPVKRDQGGGADDSAVFELIPPPKQARRAETIRQVSATQAAATIPNNMRVESTDETNLFDLAEKRQNLEMNRRLAGTGVPYVPDADPVTEKDKMEFLLRTTVEHPLKHGPWQSETAQENQLPWSVQSPHPTYQQRMMNPGRFLGNYPGFPQPEGLPAEQLTEYGFVAQPIPPVQPQYPLMPGMPVQGHYGMVMGEPDRFPGLPADWPDPRGLIPDGPQPERPVGEEKNNGPIISWVNVYKGDDSEFMQALDDYNFTFRDDKRLDGKQTILSNRKEFVAFCCRLHIWEIFSARGGAGPAEKVSRAWKPYMGGHRPY